jgi:UPF0716 protein FxsA
MRFLFLLFIVIPISELLLLFEVSDHIGAINTLLLVIATATIGVTVLRRQGFSTLRRANERMASGEIPAQEMLEGLLLGIAGALLLTPGLITDAIGFTLLTPVSRQWLARRAIASGKFMINPGMTGFHSFTYEVHSHQPPRQEAGSDIFEGEFSREQSLDRHLQRSRDDEKKSK